MKGSFFVFNLVFKIHHFHIVDGSCSLLKADEGGLLECSVWLSQSHMQHEPAASACRRVRDPTVAWLCPSRVQVRQSEGELKFLHYQVSLTSSPFLLQTAEPAICSDKS